MIDTFLNRALDFFSDASNIWNLLQVLWIVYKTASKFLSEHKDKR